MAPTSTTTANLPASIAVAQYRKWTRSRSELRESFKKAAVANHALMKERVEIENLVRMERRVFSIREAKTNAEKKEIKKVFARLGAVAPDTLFDALQGIQSCEEHTVEMLISRHSGGWYELEGKCVQFLIWKTTAGVTAHEKITSVDIDLAFSQCSQFLDSVFVGGMGCERTLPVQPMGSRKSIHSLLVNASKDRCPLTERLMESLGTATKEVLIVGWLGRFIVPELKRLVEEGVKVRIVTKSPNDAQTTSGGKDKTETFIALRDLVGPENVRVLPSSHARMVVVDQNTVFVGSMDLDSQALAERDEAALMSDDPEVITKSRKFFEELFLKGAKPKW